MHSFNALNHFKNENGEEDGGEGNGEGNGEGTGTGTGKYKGKGDNGKSSFMHYPFSKKNVF